MAVGQRGQQLALAGWSDLFAAGCQSFVAGRMSCWQGSAGLPVLSNPLSLHFGEHCAALQSFHKFVSGAGRSWSEQKASVLLTMMRHGEQQKQACTAQHIKMSFQQFGREAECSVTCCTPALPKEEPSKPPAVAKGLWLALPP